MHKTKNKIEKTRRFWFKAGKISVQLEDKYYNNEENVQIWEISDNFQSSVQIVAKIIINFRDFSVFPIFVIFSIKSDANFSSLAEISVFFSISFIFLVLFIKKNCDFGHKLRIWRIKSKKKMQISIVNWEELAIQIKDDWYINWENAKTIKIYDNFR